MPWTETCVMEERVKFIMEVLDSTYSMTELCSYYRTSRKTAYKWLDRYQQGGNLNHTIPFTIYAIRYSTQPLKCKKKQKLSFRT